MKRWIITMVLKDKYIGDKSFGVSATNRRKAKFIVDRYINDHPEIQLDDDNTYILIADKRNENDKPNIEIS